VGKLVQCKSHLQKTKNTSEPQNQFVVSTQKRMPVLLYMKWCTVIVTINFLFDFGVTKNLDNTLLYLDIAVRINSPKGSFLGLHDGLILRTSLQRKKSQRYVVLYTKMSCTQVF